MADMLDMQNLLEYQKEVSCRAWEFEINVSRSINMLQITQMIKGKNLKGYVVSLHSVWHWLRARGYFTRVKKRKQQ